MSRPKPYYATVDGKKVRVPSVTTITGRFKDSGALIYWANQVGLGEKACDEQEQCRTCGRKPGKMHRDAMNVAAGIGTYAHALIDNFVKLTPIDDAEFDHLDSDQIMTSIECLDTFKDWWDGAHVEVQETELALVSSELLFGGRMDAIGMVNGKFSVIDWKTSAGLYSDYIAQLAGYLILLEEHDFPTVEAIHIIRVSKTTAGFEHRMIPRKTLQPAIDYFVKARELYQLVKPLEALLK